MGVRMVVAVAGGWWGVVLVEMVEGREEGLRGWGGIVLI